MGTSVWGGRVYSQINVNGIAFSITVVLKKGDKRCDPGLYTFTKPSDAIGQDYKRKGDKISLSGFPFLRSVDLRRKGRVEDSEVL